ncbi:hypothetical protein ARALYDRAFT_318446 [Arabidopsis lyrata subsp. lyrata]|uniref:F-box domain-containing protein n=1 Tax=Arabidopsis lyrata subsp. lyrata TaxID=81972 RepID=D7L674_ARALL|nr:hypothetical protein ARALYDRAFT_318446 [Arabidopsis lyrata subsp. lyrata]
MAMSNLPRDLVEEVLSRLSVTSTRAVRSTCKKWNIISKDESFTTKHVAQANAAARESEFQVVMMMEYKLYLMSVNLHGIENNVDPSIEVKGKLISLNIADQIVYEIEIYNFNSDSWKALYGDRRFFVHGVSLKGNTYWFAREYVRYEGVQEVMNYRFGPRLPLPFDIFIIDNVSLSSVREEQLVVLHHQWMKLRMEIWVSNKIEPNAVSWRKLLEVNMRPLPRYRFRLDHGSFFIDEKNKVVVVLDKDEETETRNLVYFIGEDGYFKEVELGESRGKNGSPFVSSYVPSSVQVSNSQRRQLTIFD